MENIIVLHLIAAEFRKEYVAFIQSLRYQGTIHCINDDREVVLIFKLELEDAGELMKYILANRKTSCMVELPVDPIPEIVEFYHKEGYAIREYKFRLDT